jgi:hypothetical protein
MKRRAINIDELDDGFAKFLHVFVFEQIYTAKIILSIFWVIESRMKIMNLNRMQNNKKYKIQNKTKAIFTFVKQNQL